MHAERDAIGRLIKFDINDRVNYAHGMESIDPVINMPTSSNVLIESFRLYHYVSRSFVSFPFFFFIFSFITSSTETLIAVGIIFEVRARLVQLQLKKFTIAHRKV